MIFKMINQFIKAALEKISVIKIVLDELTGEQSK